MRTFGNEVNVPDEKKVDMLWRKAKAYQLERLDDAGLMTLKLKADAGGTKAQAVSDWVDSIWTEYYNRKTALLSGQDVSFSFSSLGEMPYDFYEAYSGEAPTGE
jgi:hypothetical protein